MMDGENGFGAGLSAEEEKFFATGGESTIPGDDGSVGEGNPDASSGAGEVGELGADGATDGGEGKGGDAAGKTVPLSALHEERTRRRDLDAKLREAERQLAEFKGKFSVLDRLKGGDQPGAWAHGADGAPDAGAVPNPEEDIFGAVAAITKRLESDAAAKKAADDHANFVNNYKADAARFVQTSPDYMDAYNHLLGSRAAELQAIGYEGVELGQALQADEIAIAQMAMSKGKSPAELIYALAKQRGYAPKKADEPGKGAAAPSGAERLEAIERGQAANKSLNGAGGGLGGDDMTAERLVSMPMDEFEAWCEKNPAKARRLMGG
ncbi:hypothetical protein VRZ08_01060 [Rhodopseudomonas sp. G2_2311]|uniref:hypothetical protein n=1 Tax=Rhodopseudomonas sp. G2_2311 TaxID=3114287 RepID=UPI0039C71960